MLAVKTNKNIEKFKSDVAGGFDLKEVISIVTGLFIGVIVTVFSVMVLKVPMTIAPYIAAIFIAVPILLRFLNPGGMALKDYKKKQKAYRKSSVLAYISTENPASYNLSIMKQSTDKEKDDDFKRMLKKVKIAAVLFVTAIVIIITAMIVIKYL